MKVCPRCYKEIENRANFCSYCGVNIEECNSTNRKYAYGGFLVLFLILVFAISFTYINHSKNYSGYESLQEYLTVQGVSGTDLYNTMSKIKKVDELGGWPQEHVVQYASEYLGEDVGGKIQYNDNGQLVVNFNGKDFTMKDLEKELGLSVKVDKKTDTSSGILIRETGKGILY